MRRGQLFCWGLIIFKILIGFGDSFSDKGVLSGVLLINFMKVGQSSNEHELKLNVTAVNNKHRSLDKVFGELDRHDLKQNICS